MMTSHKAGAQTMVRRKASRIARSASSMTTGVMKGSTSITATSAMKTSDKTSARIRTGDRKIVDKAEILLDIFKNLSLLAPPDKNAFVRCFAAIETVPIDKLSMAHHEVELS
jgi:hypothetical protein